MGNKFTLWRDFFDKDFDKFFVGFDDQLDSMVRMQQEFTKNAQTYPPHNVKKTGDNQYTIEMAVAGFTESDIDIQTLDGKLVITGNIKSEEPEEIFLHRGIANRAFTRTFGLNGEVEVKDAELQNGMLRIVLERIIPEAKQPKKIPVRIKGDRQLLKE